MHISKGNWTEQAYQTLFGSLHHSSHFETFWWLAAQLLKRRKKIKRKKEKHVQ
jgi:hypothetical protein